MSEISHRMIATNGINMHVAVAGEGRPVIMVHGFPGLWYSWRHQLPALAAAGYKAIAVDQRTPGRRDSSGHGRTRTVRRTERQDQNYNGEKYAAYWKYAENRQHQL